MASENLPGNGRPYFKTIPLGEPNHAASVEVVHDGLIQLTLLGPITTIRATFERHEGRDVAYRMIEAIQSITEGGRR